jgi:hypothetical protein
MARHSHRFTIAAPEAVRVLIDKIASKCPLPNGRQRLLAALDDAVRHYQGSNEKGRQALFHGLTGYAVALKL